MQARHPALNPKPHDRQSCLGILEMARPWVAAKWIFGCVYVVLRVHLAGALLPARVSLLIVLFWRSLRPPVMFLNEQLVRANSHNSGDDRDDD